MQLKLLLLPTFPVRKGFMLRAMGGDGEWDKVDCYMLPVPAALVPETIKQYVKANFPDAVINKIDKERYGYEIELSNNLELKFNKQGMLMQIDH